jgi:ankyrin repeat protein
MSCLGGGKSCAKRGLTHYGDLCDVCLSRNYESFHDACTIGNADEVRAHLQRGADADREQLSSGRTPLEVACRRGFAEIAALLVDAGADVRRRNDVNATPLMAAVVGGKLQIVRMLVERGADVRRCSRGYSTLSTLQVALRHRHFEIAAWLLERGEHYRDPDEGRWEAGILWGLCRLGRTTALQVWADRVFAYSTHPWNEQRQTPLTLACYTESPETLKTILDHGADINKRNAEGVTPLLTACFRKDQSERCKFAKLLLDHGADINEGGGPTHNPYAVHAASVEGLTPLHQACWDGSKELVELFLSHGADTEKADKKGRAPLLAACANGYAALAELLLGHGADAGVTDDDGRTPLVYACDSNDLGMAAVLLRSKEESGEVPSYR